MKKCKHDNRVTIGIRPEQYGAEVEWCKDCGAWRMVFSDKERGVLYDVTKEWVTPGKGK
jgi:hypothetical protein